MSNEKLSSLLKYQASLKDKKASPIPSKHVNRPKQYLAFLDNELTIVAKKIDKIS